MDNGPMSHGASAESFNEGVVDPKPVYQNAFAKCSYALALVGKAESETELETSCGWWRACMAAALPSCQVAAREWRNAAVQAVGDTQLDAEGMARATSIPSWSSLAACVERHAQTIAGVGTDVTLQHVATMGGVGARLRARAQEEWIGSVRSCEPLRQNMQADLISSTSAPTNSSFEADELLAMQVWMYGVASQISRCQEAASKWSEVAGMTDPKRPLLSLQPKRWEDLKSSEWQAMEDCVHDLARRADADIHAAWRQ